MSSINIRAAELERWWHNLATEQIEMVVPKAIEYGATDLEDIGQALIGRGASAEAQAEAGIAFYALGKISRIMAAIKADRRPSRDSWLDLSIYAAMALRVLEHGAWPGLDLEED